MAYLQAGIRYPGPIPPFLLIIVVFWTTFDHFYQESTTFTPLSDTFAIFWASRGSSWARFRPKSAKRRKTALLSLSDILAILARFQALRRATRARKRRKRQKVTIPALLRKAAISSLSALLRTLARFQASQGASGWSQGSIPGFTGCPRCLRARFQASQVSQRCLRGVPRLPYPALVYSSCTTLPCTTLSWYTAVYML